MLSVSVISGDAAYYSGAENVETLENAEGQWLGKGAEALGLSGAVVPDRLDALLQGHLPDGTRLTRQKDGKETNRPGLDLTFGAPKSLSILALLGGDTRLTEAHNAAARQAMLEVERSVNTRLTRDGVTRTVATGNMVAALFTHDTNRAGEMHLHDHGLLLNLTQAEGKWHALGSDTRHRSGIREMVYDMKLAYGQLYREFLRPGVEAAGYTPVDSGPHGMFELAEVPRAVVEAYSQRTAQIDAAVGREASALSRAVAALDTRQSKTFVDGDTRRAQWTATLDGLDFDPAAVIAAAKARSQPERDVGPGIPGEALSPKGRPLSGPGVDTLQPDSPGAGALLQAAVTQAVSALSDKKAQFAYSEVLAAVVSRLPAEAGMVQRARDGIEAARAQGRLVALDRDKGLFTSDIHLLDELTLRQFAREHSESGRAMVSGAALLSGRLPDVTGVYAELAQARDPLAVLAGRGGMAVQRGRMEQLTDLARAQGRQVMILAADNRSARFLGESETLAGSLVGRSALREELPLSAWSTVIVTEAESLTLKESVLLLTQARASGAQILLMDSGKRQGTGSALSVLKDEAVVVRAFNDAEKPSVQLVSEPDKKVRYQALAQEYAREVMAGQTVVAQVAGAREQRLLTADIRDALRAEGMLAGAEVRVATLSPVWLDSKNRLSRETYRAGMVMERWQAEAREMQRWHIDRVGEETNILRLVNEAGAVRTEKISQLDSQWRLYAPGEIAVATGDTLKVTGSEARGKLKAQETVQVVGTQDGTLTLMRVGANGDNAREGKALTLDISQPLKLAHGYVEPVGQSVRAEGRVLAALSGREMRDEVINQLVRSGNDIRLFTALDPVRADAKLARHPLVRVVSAQVEAATGTQGQGTDAALDAAAALPRTPAAQSVFLALSQVQHERMAFQAPRLLSAAISINPTVPVMAIRHEIDRQVRDGELVSPENSSLLVPRETFETEKAIIRHIAEGKGAVAPLMPAVPDALLQGLTQGQQTATRMVLESADRFTAVQGYAGVGKTTQFRAMLTALDTLPADQRPEVVGLAPTHRAVEEMQSVGVRAQTLDSFLFEDRQARQNGEKPDYGRTLFLVDEASMVGNRAMSEAYQAVAAGGGR
ncbi:MobF family relaxase [Cedecea sp. NFIX57]|uniref:MobF family relaxase n=1 Tax=Cedecea sp. NFIX57 TaxID=1566286 RepID=UPI000A0A5CC3|nr:MobF family relaxase [Cedecea sp. NFIX57]SMG60293.1 conjugative transfer relaxase protein TraI [Cedecea sp. NFIX57]